MKYCPNCGRQEDDSKRFCTDCGKELQYMEAPAAAPAAKQEPAPTAAEKRRRELQAAAEARDEKDLNKYIRKGRKRMIIGVIIFAALTVLYLVGVKGTWLWLITLVQAALMAFGVVVGDGKIEKLSCRMRHLFTAAALLLIIPFSMASKGLTPETTTSKAATAAVSAGTSDKGTAETALPAEAPAATAAPTAKPTPTPKPTAKPTPKPTPTPAVAMVDGMRKNFKEAMDSYDAFFDEYIEFIAAYEKNPSNMNLLLKYAGMLEQLSETMEKMEDWDDGTMNKAEEAYYLKIMGKITGKLYGALGALG